MDGTGLRFETLDHGGEYPDTMPQAIKLIDAEGRSCVYVPITQDGKVVDSQGYVFDPKNECGDRVLIAARTAPRKCVLHQFIVIRNVGVWMPRLTLVGIVLALGAAFLSAGISTSVSAQEAKSVSQFCAIWERICNRTCTTGPGTCSPVCSSRRSACTTSGCFHFNSPGPRCFANAQDRGLTDLKLAPNPEAERKRRARE